MMFWLELLDDEPERRKPHCGCGFGLVCSALTAVISIFNLKLVFFPHNKSKSTSLLRLLTNLVDLSVSVKSGVMDSGMDHHVRCRSFFQTRT